MRDSESSPRKIREVAMLGGARVCFCLRWACNEYEAGLACVFNHVSLRTTAPMLIIFMVVLCLYNFCLSFNISLRTCTVYSSNTDSTISSELWYPTPQWMKMRYFSQPIQQMME